MNAVSTASLVVLAAFGALFGALWLSQPGSLPELEPGQVHSLKLLDRNGFELRDIPSGSGVRGQPVNLEAIPLQLRQAFIQGEDRRFHTHPGVDLLAFARALWQNLKAGERVSGASTITMQSARMAFGLGRGYWDKLRQIVIALKLERSHSKGNLLEHYLNHVPFSSNVVGVAQACRFYFSSDCDRLTPAQSATLAALVRAPSRLWNDKVGLQKRRDELLNRMAASGHLSGSSARLAMAEALPVDSRRADFLAPHFTEKVLAELGADIGAGGHGRVRTSLDVTLQRDVQALTQQHVAELAGHNVNAAAVLVVENASGQVLAYVGSPDYFDDANNGKADYVQTLRQPGSTLKPFTYALAMAQGYTLATLLPDVPLVLTTADGAHRPKNYGGTFSGPRRLREALANSLNVPALHTAIQLGSHALLRWYHRLGLASLTREADFYGPGLTLGNGEISLWELTRAYVVLARGGNAVALSTTLPSEASGAQAKAGGRQLMDERIAYLLGDALQDAQAREAEFGRGGPLEFKYPVAVKTGTSTDFRDNWAVGYSGAVTVGVWVGNERGRALRNVTGVSGAAPLFQHAMNRAMQSRPKNRRPVPSGLVEARLCPLSGKLSTPACEGELVEIFRTENVPTERDDFYRRVTARNCNGAEQTLTYVKLPGLYSEWAQSMAMPTLEKMLRERCGGSDVVLSRAPQSEDGAPRVEILEPRDGSFYARDPHIPDQLQKAAIRLLLPEEAVQTEWHINGQIKDLQQTARGVFLWNMDRGVHRLKAKVRLANGEWLETKEIETVVF